MNKLSQKESLAAMIGVVVVLLFFGVPLLFLGASKINGGVSLDNLAGSSNSPKTTAGGHVVINDVVVGKGALAQSGDVLAVHYIGALSDGTVFDSSIENSDPLMFRLGEGKVITGWEEGLQGMRVGGTRRLLVPASMGYGSKEVLDENGSVIVPADSELLFDVVLMGINPRNY